MLKKSSLKIGINGLGRIGRLVFRQGFESLNIVAVNGTQDPNYMAHYLKYDSVHGLWDKNLVAKNKELIVEGKPIACFKENTPQEVPWDKYNVDLVIECTGRFKSLSDWEKVFSKGVKKVIVSAPANTPDLTFIYGVNHQDYKVSQHRFISNSSCTTNCLSLVIDVLKKHCGVKKGFFSTIHSYTNDQKLLDSSHKKDLRRARAAGLNIIPTSTGAGSALSLIFPELKGKVSGMAFRVPTANVSLLDLTIESHKKTSLNHLYKAFKTASLSHLKGLLAIEEQALVSSDFIGRTESAIIDWPLSLELNNNLFKIIAWYDNEAGFSQRIIDFIHYTEGLK